jgi:hypothetical protein
MRLRGSKGAVSAQIATASGNITMQLVIMKVQKTAENVQRSHMTPYG